MKRMIDNKKLKEIEGSGGTQWYEHLINFKNGSLLKFITIRKDALKDGGWPIGKFPIILLDYGGSSPLKPEYSFPLLNKHASDSLEISYINSTNERALFTFSEAKIASEEITPL